MPLCVVAAAGGIPTAGNGAPWWFAGATALGGVIIGVLAKWWIDRSAERRHHAREDRLRFAENRLEAFAEFLTAVISERGAWRRYKNALAETPQDVTKVARRAQEFETANLAAMKQQQVLALLSPATTDAVRKCMEIGPQDDEAMLSDATEALRSLAREELPSAPESKSTRAPASRKHLPFGIRRRGAGRSGD